MRETDLHQVQAGLLGETDLQVQLNRLSCQVQAGLQGETDLQVQLNRLSCGRSSFCMVQRPHSRPFSFSMGLERGEENTHSSSFSRSLEGR